MGPNMGFGPLPGGYQQPVYGVDPKRKRLAIIFVAVVVFLSLVTVFSILSKRKDPVQQNLVEIGIQENELLRMSIKNNKNIKSATLKRHDAELDETMTTNAILVTAELKRAYKMKALPSAKQKAAIDKKTDESLATSASLNRFDQDYAQTVSDKLAKQIELAQQAQGQAKSQKTKDVLKVILDSTTLLHDRFADNQTDSTTNTTPSQQ